MYIHDIEIGLHLGAILSVGIVEIFQPGQSCGVGVTQCGLEQDVSTVSRLQRRMVGTDIGRHCVDISVRQVRLIIRGEGPHAPAVIKAQLAWVVVKQVEGDAPAAVLIHHHPIVIEPAILLYMAQLFQEVRLHQHIAPLVRMLRILARTVGGVIDIEQMLDLAGGIDHSRRGQHQRTDILALDSGTRQWCHGNVVGGLRLQGEVARHFALEPWTRG